MAMRHSDEQAEVIKLLYQELDHLKINDESTDLEIGLIDEQTGMAKMFAHIYQSDGQISTFDFPMTHLDPIRKEFELWKSTPYKRSEIFITNVFTGEALKQFKDTPTLYPHLSEAFLPFQDDTIHQWVTTMPIFTWCTDATGTPTIFK